jgi:hypothetical protein
MRLPSWDRYWWTWTTGRRWMAVAPFHQHSSFPKILDWLDCLLPGPWIWKCFF